MNEKATSNILQHKSWIDFLKVLGTFFIIFNHSIATIWTSVSPNTFLWKFSHVPFLFSRIMILIFFMCSGSTMLNKERSISTLFRKNIFSLFKIYFFWMLIYGFESCIIMYQEGTASFRTCLNALVKAVLFGHYHTWFLFTLAALYLITPFLYQILQSKKLTQYFLILSIVFTILISTMQPISTLNRLTESFSNFNMKFVTGYVIYYVAGYYISNLKRTRLLALGSLLLFIITFSISCGLTMYQSLQAGTATFESFNDFSLLTFLSTISFFGIMKSTESFSFPVFFSKIATYGLGIYLMHPLFVEYILPIKDFRIYIIIPFFYLFCLLTCYLLSKNKILCTLFIK